MKAFASHACRRNATQEYEGLHITRLQTQRDGVYATQEYVGLRVTRLQTQCDGVDATQEYESALMEKNRLSLGILRAVLHFYAFFKKLYLLKYSTDCFHCQICCCSCSEGSS